MVKPIHIFFFIVSIGIISSCETSPVVYLYEIANKTKSPLVIGYGTIDGDSITLKTISPEKKLLFFTTENKYIGKYLNSQERLFDTAAPFRTIIIYPDSFAHTYSEYLDREPQHHKESYDNKSGRYKLISERYFRESEIINFSIISPNKNWTEN